MSTFAPASAKKNSDDHKPRDPIKRPGISNNVLISAGIRYSDYPEPGSIAIPYWTAEGEITGFTRYRRPDGSPNGKYYQEPDSEVYAYYAPGFFRRHPDIPFRLAANSIVLVEGEFKCLSLLEEGVPAIGIPSFIVYMRDENGNRRLLRDLQVSFSREKPAVIYYLGDSDTATNFEFSRQAAFLASAAYPAKIMLPRIPIDQPKGIDDCKEALGEKFGEFFTDLIKDAISLDRKSDATSLALLLLERGHERIAALKGMERERQYDRIVKMVGAAQRVGETNATARLRKLAAKIIRISESELKKAIRIEEDKNRDAYQQSAKTKPRPKDSRPELILPCHHVGVNECARNCFPILAETRRYFMRSRTLFEIGSIKEARLIPIEPDAFCSQLENYFRLFAYIKAHGKLEQVKRCCSAEDAKKLIKCDPARDLLPPIQLVTASPVFVEREGKLEILRKGYHEVLGGIYVSHDYDIVDVPLAVAVSVIKSLATDFGFVAESDRSRFLSGIIAPALRFGGLVKADFPVFLNEADKSQAGKTYGHKVLCKIYNERPFAITLNDERNALGSHDEKLSKGLIEAHPFIMWENARGLVGSQLAESAIRGTGTVTCRIAYMAPIEVETDKFMWLLSSNKASVTPDLAARSLITRMRKQPDSYQYQVFGDGHDLLQEVGIRCSYYLSCILAIISEWVKKGRPHTNDRRHDFTEACQALDWIIQNTFNLAPLLDDHQVEQDRISNPLLNWLRDIALIIEKNKKLEEWLRASEIANFCADHGLAIPQCHEDADEKTRNQVVGRIFKNLFKTAQILSVSGFTVKRDTFEEYDPYRQENLDVTRHFFEKNDYSKLS